MSSPFYSYEDSEQDFLPNTTRNQEHLDSLNQSPNRYSLDLNYKLPGMSSSPRDPALTEQQTPPQVPERTATPAASSPRIFESPPHTRLPTPHEPNSDPHYTRPPLQQDESPRTQWQSTGYQAKQPQMQNLQTEVHPTPASVPQNLRSAPQRAREAGLDDEMHGEEDGDELADYKIKNTLAARKSRQKKKDEYAAAIEELEGLRVWKARAKGKMERAERMEERLEAEKSRREVELLAVINALDKREKCLEDQLAAAMREIAELKKMLGLTA